MDHLKKWEIIISAMGVIVVLVLGYGQNTINSRQIDLAKFQLASNEKYATNNIEAEMISLASPYFKDLTNTGPEHDKSAQVITAISEYLTAEHGKTGLATITSKIISKSAEVSLKTKLRIAEATESEPETTRWHLVVGSFELTQLESAQTFLKQINITHKRHTCLFQTKISQQYAVTIEGDLSFKEAKELNKTLFVDDQFIQQDKNWRCISCLNDQ